MIPLPRRSRESAMPDITPLLDMVFILLIFFVIAAAFAVHGVDLRLPKSSSARAYAGKPIEIVLSADGTLKHKGKVVSLRDVSFLVKANADGKGKNRQILLIPDRAATVGDFMTTVSVIRENGGERLVIAADPTVVKGVEP